MKNRRVEDQTKGKKQIERLKFVVGCMLIGSVVAGVCSAWFNIPFDPRVIGASIGATAGMVANHFA